MKTSHIAAIFLLIILGGLGVYAYQAMSVAGNIKVVDVSLRSLDLDVNWVAGVPVPKEARLTIDVTVHNPTGYSVEVDEIRYEVYIEETFLGEGSRREVIITPGVKHLHFPLTISAGDALKVFKEVLEEATESGFKDVSIDYEIKGFIKAPIKLFNIFDVGIKASIPFEYEGSYLIHVPLPPISPPSWPPAPSPSPTPSPTVPSPAPVEIAVFTNKESYYPLENVVIYARLETEPQCSCPHHTWILSVYLKSPTGNVQVWTTTIVGYAGERGFEEVEAAWTPTIPGTYVVEAYLVEHYAKAYKEIVVEKFG